MSPGTVDDMRDAFLMGRAKFKEWELSFGRSMMGDEIRRQMKVLFETTPPEVMRALRSKNPEAYEAVLAEIKKIDHLEE